MPCRSVLIGLLGVVLLAGCTPLADTRQGPLSVGTPPPGPPLVVAQSFASSCAQPHAALVACNALASTASATVELGADTESSRGAVLSIAASQPTYSATLSFPGNYVQTVLGNLEVALLPYNDWRRLTPRPTTTRSIGPVAVDYEGVKAGVRGIRMHVQLTYKPRAGKIGDTTMRVRMRGPAVPS